MHSIVDERCASPSPPPNGYGSDRASIRAPHPAPRRRSAIRRGVRPPDVGIARVVLLSRVTLSDEAESTVSDGLLPPREKACHRGRGRQGQALRVAAKRRPSLTAVRHGSAIELRSGRKNGFAEGRTEKCTVRQFSSQLFVFKLNEGADGVSIAICA